MPREVPVCEAGSLGEGRCKFMLRPSCFCSMFPSDLTGYSLPVKKAENQCPGIPVDSRKAPEEALLNGEAGVRGRETTPGPMKAEA